MATAKKNLDFCAAFWVFDYFLELSHQLLCDWSRFAVADCAFVDFSDGHHFHCGACEECFVSSEEHEGCQVSYDEVYAKFST